MLISCICPTFARAPEYLHLIEESVECFLRQEWEEKELIVLNDTPGQVLSFRHSDVRIINLPRRVDSLGEKYNLAIKAARGVLICPWEDDDIILPWRLRLSVEVLGDADYYNPQCYWFLDGADLHHEHNMGYGHAMSTFRYSAWKKVGGYPEVSGPQDALMDGILRQQCSVADARQLSRDEWFYIYRWGVSPHHLSGWTDGEAHYREIGQQTIVPGEYTLHPHYDADYEAMCHDHIKEHGLK